MLHATRAALSRRFDEFDDALDAWAERHWIVLRVVGFAVSFTLLAGGVALQALESGFTHAVAALCDVACTAFAGHQIIIALACGGAAVLFVWMFATLASAVQRVLFDPWQHVRPGPPPPRLARWVMILHVLIGFALFSTMAWFGQKLVHGRLFELSIEGPETSTVRLGDRAMLGLILGWWNGGSIVLKFFWLRSSRYARFAHTPGRA